MQSALESVLTSAHAFLVSATVNISGKPERHGSHIRSRMRTPKFSDLGEGLRGDPQQGSVGVEEVASGICLHSPRTD